MTLLARLGAGPLATVALMATCAPAFAQTAAPAAFAACRACHIAQKDGSNGIGPNLYGVVGRAAASVPRFNYSSALKGSQLRWDEQTLDEFIAAPSKKVPGTRMPIGMADPKKRAEIIAYLKAEGAK